MKTTSKLTKKYPGHNTQKTAFPLFALPSDTPRREDANQGEWSHADGNQGGHHHAACGRHRQCQIRRRLLFSRTLRYPKSGTVGKRRSRTHRLLLPPLPEHHHRCLGLPREAVRQDCRENRA